jgi:hypothetical protein
MNKNTLSLNTIIRLINQKEDIEKIADLVIKNPSSIEELVWLSSTL